MKWKREKESMMVHEQKKHAQISPILSNFKNCNKRPRLRDDSSVTLPNLEKSMSYNVSDSSEDFHPMEHLQKHKKGRKTSGHAKGRKLNLKTRNFNRKSFVHPCGKTNIISKNQRHNINSPSYSNAGQEYIETREYEKFSHSNFLDNHMETTLIEVNVSMESTYREVNVPFVCLTSQFNGKPIIGHPLEIGVLSDSSEISLPGEKRVGCALFGNEGFVWRTSKRTRVCYDKTILYHSISENLIEKGDSKGKSLKKLKKNPSHLKKEREEGMIKACVPVKTIFSKILAAVSKV